MKTVSLIQLSATPLKRLFTYIRPYRLRFWLSVFYSAMNKIFDLAPPVMVAIAVDIALGNPLPVIDSLTGGSMVNAAVLMGVVTIIIFAAESIFQWLYSVGFMKLSQLVQHDLRLDAYSSMQNREMEFFEEHRLGETMSMLNDDINQLERFLHLTFNDIVQMAALVVVAGTILFSSSLTMGLIAISPIPVVVLGSIRFQRLLAPKYRAVREAVADVNTRLENNIAGIGVIKAFSAQEFEKKRLETVSSAYKKTNIAAIKFSALFVPIIRMIISLGLAGVIGMGIYVVHGGIMTAGTFTLFTMMCQRILWPLTRLGTVLDETQRGRQSAARVFGLLDTGSKITDKPGALPLVSSRGELAFEGVSFRYSRGENILKDFNLKLKSGEVVGIAGATGAGKSSLVKLILRFYDPGEGCVRLDGHDIRDITLESLRNQVALVSQDVYLFQGSIRENIAYPDTDVDDEVIMAAAKKARLHDFISGLQGGYDTLVGERGIKLSGGQRQRLSIARAILKDAPVLILDEATSSVDTETEREIQTHLEEYTRKRTAILIAHRLSTIRNADRIVVLKDGSITETGTHDVLIRSKGTYADLWELQAGTTPAGGKM